MEDIRSAKKKSVPQSVKLTEDELYMVSGGAGEYYGRPDPEMGYLELCPTTKEPHVWYKESNGITLCRDCGKERGYN